MFDAEVQHHIPAQIIPPTPVACGPAGAADQSARCKPVWQQPGPHGGRVAGVRRAPRAPRRGGRFPPHQLQLLQRYPAAPAHRPPPPALLALRGMLSST
ncbi:unnamed protein product [Plutella xylostella]|uniref:(diamondback moth) hypothetical protein n=1 Tax=Plutella xylostella TaxID=51655 RepID=A0A8S4FJE0_PLUXY|nr:unnamed protein product [Plutella xylostella]